MRIGIRHVVLLLLLLVFMADCALAKDFARARAAMIREIEADVRRTSGYIGKRQLADGVMEAMATVPRHLFVPESRRKDAYENRPLEIGYGQTISQPYIVALMTDLLDPQPAGTIIEVGTGSGYQAAVLSRLVRMVYTIEIIPALAASAAERLGNLGYRNVRVLTGDGYFGMPHRAPFDNIIVTAAASHIPPPLVRQLNAGGKMVVPVGSPWTVQQLTLVLKDGQGNVQVRQVLPVAFVPLTGGH